MSDKSLRIENWELRNAPLLEDEPSERGALSPISQFSFFNSQFSIPLPP